jgi:transketolase
MGFSKAHSGGNISESRGSRVAGSRVVPLVSEVEIAACAIRRDIIRMIAEAGSGHPGGSLSAADIVAALYFSVMRINPQQPNWPERDRFILSKGHACPVWYAALAERGYFDRSALNSLRKINSILQGHADMTKTPGVDMTVGSLGQGLSVGVGMALAGKLRQLNYHVWVLMGDGEMQEGSVWEAAMSAPKWGLGNLTAIVDINGLQNDGRIEDVMPIGSLRDKWRSFNWEVREINGHEMSEIVISLNESRLSDHTPTVILAHTVKGKGVSFMEDSVAWHGRAPTQKEAEQAIQEIDNRLQMLRDSMHTPTRS